MLAKATGVLALLLISGQAQGQGDAEFRVQFFSCANQPFTFSCPSNRVITIKSITIYASVSDPTPLVAARNDWCRSNSNISSCYRTFKDPSDQGFKELPEYDYFYKWLHILCFGKSTCNGTMPAPNRLHGINKVCSDVDIAYFVVAFTDIECVSTPPTQTFAPLPETTTPSPSPSSTEPTEAPPVLVPIASGSLGLIENRATTTSVALQVTNPKTTNNLLNAFIDLSWLRNEGLSIYSRQHSPQLCLVSVITLVVLFHLKP